MPAKGQRISQSALIMDAASTAQANDVSLYSTEFVVERLLTATFRFPSYISWYIGKSEPVLFLLSLLYVNLNVTVNVTLTNIDKKGNKYVEIKLRPIT